MPYQVHLSTPDSRAHWTSLCAKTSTGLKSGLIKQNRKGGCNLLNRHGDSVLDHKKRQNQRQHNQSRDDSLMKRNGTGSATLDEPAIPPKQHHTTRMDKISIMRRN